jgi:hypothetical protein
VCCSSVSDRLGDRFQFSHAVFATLVRVIQLLACVVLQRNCLLGAGLVCINLMSLK